MDSYFLGITLICFAHITSIGKIKNSRYERVQRVPELFNDFGIKITSTFVTNKLD